MKLLFAMVAFGLFIGECSAKGMEPSVFTIDMNDILNEKLMPASFLMLEGPENPEDLVAESRNEADAVNPTSGLVNLTREDGTFGTAYSTMGFHRKMINSYLCNGFVANQIMSEVIPGAIGISRRVGTGLMVTDSINPSSKDTMLYDQGSSGYVDWLSKSTTLDDIYRNYLSPSMSVNSTDHSNHRADLSQPISKPRVGVDEYFDEGVITGYAVHHPDPQTMQQAQLPYQGGHNPYQHHRSSYNPNHFQHSNSPPAFAPQPAASHTHNQYELLQGETPYNEARGDYSYHTSIGIEEKTIGKGLGLKDLFDIALTTLAFLSFGMFILQVIMCITMTKTDANMMMIPVDTDVDGDGAVEVRRRTARSLLDMDSARLREINQIARRVLDSMDAALYARQDEGQCVQRVICEGQRMSKELKYTRGYWISMWNLGISWLAGNMVDPNTSSGAILGCLRAMLVGLGGGKCDKVYACTKPQSTGSIKF
ncbi:uncharacterized protein LOC134213723 [Armigeres subalbatus]|uniref:uncharacterized protein LOC134213723 n=1 Tax=Armigeres subalbatus TaxID=124917 RepID=UPI002ED52B98